MTLEDALLVATHCQLEQEKLERSQPAIPQASSGYTRTEVIKEIHFDAPKTKKRN